MLFLKLHYLKRSNKAFFCFIIFSSFIILYYELNKLQLKSSLCYRQKYDLIFTNEVCNASLTISFQKFNICISTSSLQDGTVCGYMFYHPLSLKIINNYKTVLHSTYQIYIVEITLLYRNIQPRCNILCCALL